MEAKDTVMDDKAMVQAITDNPNVPMGQALIEKQAEISFKAGMEEESTQAYHAGLHDGILRGRKESLDNALPVTLEDIKKAGMKEVVEWIEKNSSDEETAHESHMSSGEFFLGINPEEWQAQLKEWGL